MDILMIGHSGSGKTTFMAGLYARMKDGVAGFGIDSNFYEYYKKQKNYHGFLQQKKDLDTIVSDLFMEKYPSPTMIRQEYYFNLVCNGYSIPFNWYDYRGGALMEKVGSSSDAEDFVKKIQSADAMVIFIDGDTLMESLSSTIRQYRRLIAYVNNALAIKKRYKDEHFPISFVITKGDLYDAKKLLNSDGFNYFKQNLFVPIRQSHSVIGMYTITEVNPQYIYNVHFPLLFSILFTLPRYVRNQKKIHESEVDNLGPFECIGEFFTDNRKQRFIETMEAIRANMNKLAGIIKEANHNEILIF